MDVILIPEMDLFNFFMAHMTFQISSLVPVFQAIHFHRRQKSGELFLALAGHCLQAEIGRCF
jgi:hypothetical protein